MAALRRCALLALAAAPLLPAQDLEPANAAAQRRRLLDSAISNGWVHESKAAPEPSKAFEGSAFGEVGTGLALESPQSDLLVQHCAALFQRTAFQRCETTFEFEVISGSIELISGFLLTLQVKIEKQYFHEVRCSFDIVGYTEAVKDLDLDAAVGDQVLPEEREGLRGEIIMDIDICDSAEKSSTESPVPSFVGRFEVKRSGEMSHWPGYEHLYDHLPRWANELQVKATAQDFSLRKKAPLCFPDGGASVVRTQGACGSCWAFAASTAIMTTICVAGNGKNALKADRERFEISVQRMMTCNAHSFGCNGGHAGAADSVFKGPGIALESVVPYRCGSGSSEGHFTMKNLCQGPTWGGSQKTCDATVAHEKWSIGRMTQLRGEAEMMNAMVDGNALYMTFTVYANLMAHRSGVYDTLERQNLGGHAVVGIGYGVLDGKNYWEIQNSWGTSFGEDGYFKMLRGKNLAGIENVAVMWEGAPYPGAFPSNIFIDTYDKLVLRANGNKLLVNVGLGIAAILIIMIILKIVGMCLKRRKRKGFR